MMLDDRGVHALGKVSEQRKLSELARAEVLCASSLHGESFGMILTEAFAAATPVIASDIPGYRDVVRDGLDGQLVPAGDALALAEALRRLALDPARRARMAVAARERAERFAWPHVAAEVLDCYEQARSVGSPATRLGRAAVRHGLSPADRLPRIPAQRLASLQAVPAQAVAPRRLRTLRRAALLTSWLAGAGLAALALQRVGVGHVAASLVASDARSKAPSSASSSRVLPTRGKSARCSRSIPRRERALTASHTRIGSALPFATTGSRSS